MDPLACLLRAADALSAGDHHEACNALDDYYDWRNAGGFEPTTTSGQRGDDYADELVRAARKLRRAS